MTTRKSRTWFAYVILALLMGCASTAKVEKATSQQWHGGAAGSGGGKNYVVHVAKPSNPSFEVERVWLGDREKGWLVDFRVRYADLADFHNNHSAPKGVTQLTVEFAETFAGQPNPRGGEVRPNFVKPFDPVPSDLPEGFDKGVVIYYQLGGKSANWVIADFQQLPTLNYP